MNENKTTYIRRNLTLDPGGHGDKWCICDGAGRRISRWFDTRAEASAEWQRKYGK